MWWNRRNGEARRAVEAVVAAFNTRDFATLASYLLPAFTLVDGVGERVSGRDQALSLLERLTTADPQFRMVVEELTSHGDDVFVSGYTTGFQRSCAPQRTLWKVLFRGGRIAEWHSFSADTAQPSVRLLKDGVEGRSSLRVAAPC